MIEVTKDNLVAHIGSHIEGAITPEQRAVWLSAKEHYGNGEPQELIRLLLLDLWCLEGSARRAEERGEGDERRNADAEYVAALLDLLAEEFGGARVWGRRWQEREAWAWVRRNQEPP